MYNVNHDFEIPNKYNTKQVLLLLSVCIMSGVEEQKLSVVFDHIMF